MVWLTRFDYYYLLPQRLWSLVIVKVAAALHAFEWMFGLVVDQDLLHTFVMHANC
jgi:hypothetical protein